MPKEEDISQFLREFKALMSTGRDFDFLERPEKNLTFTRLGLNYTTGKEVLYGLSVTNYSSGPEHDRDRRGDVWIFGTEINGHEIYIKLKVYSLGPERKAKCISFHEADHPLNYPIKK